MVSYEKNNIRLSFLGGCGEVGRVAIKIELKDKALLLDYGVALSEDGPKFPYHVRPREITSIVLSHAHLDHSGALPYLFSSGISIPIYTTSLTAKLSRLLLDDFLHISGYHLPFEEQEIKLCLNSVRAIRYSRSITIEDVSIRAINAGHIPGSIMTLIETPRSNILFTGDFNLVKTQLLNPATLSKVDFSKIDIVIMESTYANVDHPERQKLEKEFVEKCREVVDRGGIVLVPAFAVGRSQEILCVLRRYNFEYPIVLDGMARQASRILLSFPEFVRDYKLFKSALSYATWITGWSERRRALKSPGVIVTPAGMLKGGAALYYLYKIYKDPRNAVFLVSYQIEGTPGRELLETHKFRFKDTLEEVKAEVKWFDFSAHCGRKELFKFLSLLKPGTKVFIIHGEQEAIKQFAMDINETFDLEVIVPKMGATYTY